MKRGIWYVPWRIAIDRSILDWHLCRMVILELLAQPHSSMPYVHMGFIATLYTRTLFSRDNGDFLPKSQYSCNCSILNTFLFIRPCLVHVSSITFNASLSNGSRVDLHNRTDGRTWPKIENYSDAFAEYNQQYTTFHNLFISLRHCTCFTRVFRPSSGAQNCTYSVRYLSD